MDFNEWKSALAAAATTVEKRPPLQTDMEAANNLFTTPGTALVQLMLVNKRSHSCCCGGCAINPIIKIPGLNCLV